MSDIESGLNGCVQPVFLCIRSSVIFLSFLFPVKPFGLRFSLLRRIDCFWINVLFEQHNANSNNYHLHYRDNPYNCHPALMIR